jgi:peptidoglycan hydrolase-like protein with peptidoglycan-binding domain
LSEVKEKLAMAKPQQLNQAQTLDQLNRYMLMASARNKDAARVRAEWQSWFDALGWHERNVDPRVLIVGKACCVRFIACNGSSFGAERRTLRQGMTGDDVKAMQTIVGATSDGHFGPGTARAVVVWQKKNGLTADGVFGPASWAKSDSAGITDADRQKVLGLVGLTTAQSIADAQSPAATSVAPAQQDAPVAIVPSTAVAHPTIRLHSAGDSVKEWQGILGLNKDGHFGPATEKATKTFQASHRIKADGVVGPKTWMAAYSANTAMTNVAQPGVVIDSTGTLPPAMAPTTKEALAAPAGAAVMARPIGQPIKPSLIERLLHRSPKTAPSTDAILNSPSTNGHPGDFVGRASVSYWNPLTWRPVAQVLGVLFVGGSAVAISRETKHSKRASR